MNAHDHDAALEAALEQQVRGEQPPDLTERILAATGETPGTGPIRSQRWLSAAITLFALCLVVAIWSIAGSEDRSARSGDRQDPVPWHEGLLVPESVEDARRLLGEHDEVTARVFAVRDPSSGAFVAVVTNPFENLLAPLFTTEKAEPKVRGDAAQDSAWTMGLLHLLRGRSRDGDRFATHPLELLFRVPERGTVVVGIDDTVDPVRCQVRGLPMVWTIPSGHPLPVSIREATDALLGQAIEDRGIALGRAGLDRLPASSPALRPYSLGPDDLATIGRFTELATLDLSGSPEAVTPEALRHLQGCEKLRSLVIPADGIGAAHLEPIVALPELRELFVGATPLSLFFEAPLSTTNAIDDECARLLTRASGLSELWLSASDLTDAGVALLAELPLRSLFVGSPRITGTGFAAFANSPTLRSLAVYGPDRLTIDGLRAIGVAAGDGRSEAETSSLRELILIGCPLSVDGLAALLDAGRPDNLHLGRCRPDTSWPELLATIAGARCPKRLSLVVDGDLRIEHLVHLAGARNLKSLQVAVTREQEISAEVVEQLGAALGEVSVDVWHGPR